MELTKQEKQYLEAIVGDGNPTKAKKTIFLVLFTVTPFLVFGFLFLFVWENLSEVQIEKTRMIMFAASNLLFAIMFTILIVQKSRRNALTTMIILKLHSRIKELEKISKSCKAW